ncbi:MAG: hydrogenase iron-sulfur subunit [Candidatus Atribacteria bacterium]|nr:hydrogenase iron-sulfur subunit [Candidatus Atribacteria bacterium]
MKLYVIACDKSGYPALMKGIETGEGTDSVLTVQKIPCLGLVKESLLLETLEKEYDGILLVGCPLDSCYNLDGSRFAERRVHRVNALLQEAGIEKKVFLAFVTAEKTGELQRVLMLARSAFNKEESPT